jgi:AAA15 family ATPase/GTPase
MKIEGCKRINVFIGYPNVGKSNILEALSLFSLPYLKIAGSKKLTDFIRVKNLPGLFYGTEIETPIKVDINNSLHVVGTMDLKRLYPLEWAYTSEEVIDEKIVLLHDTLKILFNKELKAKFENSSKKVGGLGPFEILKYHFSIDNFKPDTTVYPSLIPSFGNNLFEVIRLNDDLNKILGREFEKVGGEYIYDTDDNTGKILKGNNGKRFTLPFSSMADTLQRLIFHKAAIASNKNAVLLFEEPESHMFPPYIRLLMGDIIYDKEQNNQYFINTHSPFVLDDLVEDARAELSIFLVDLKNGETTIKRLSDEELDEVYQYGVDLFYNIQSYLD